MFWKKEKKKKTLVREHGKIFTSHLWNPSYLTLIFLKKIILKRMINSLLIKAPPKVIKPWWYNNYSPAEQPPLPAQQKMRNKISTRNSKGCGFINLWNNTCLTTHVERTKIRAILCWCMHSNHMERVQGIIWWVKN